MNVTSAANADALSEADGSATTTEGGTSVGVAVALSTADISNQALLEHATVTASQVTLSAEMAERSVDITPADPISVDLDAETIYVGDIDDLETGDEISYSNGGEAVSVASPMMAAPPNTM